MSKSEMVTLFSGAMLRGFGALVVAPRIEIPQTGFNDDREALRGDWEAIGDDFNESFEKCTHETAGSR